MQNIWFLSPLVQRKLRHTKLSQFVYYLSTEPFMFNFTPFLLKQEETKTKYACSIWVLKWLSDAYGFNSFRGISSLYSEITYECPCNCTNSSAIWGLINSQNVQGKKDFLKLQWIALIICFFFTFFHLYFKENAANTSNTACICCILWEIMP